MTAEATAAHKYVQQQLFGRCNFFFGSLQQLVIKRDPAAYKDKPDVPVAHVAFVRKALWSSCPANAQSKRASEAAFSRARKGLSEAEARSFLLFYHEWSALSKVLAVHVYNEAPDAIGDDAIQRVFTTLRDAYVSRGEAEGDAGEAAEDQQQTQNPQPEGGTGSVAGEAN